MQNEYEKHFTACRTVLQPALDVQQEYGHGESAVTEQQIEVAYQQPVYLARVLDPFAHLVLHGGQIEKLTPAILPTQKLMTVTAIRT